MTAKEDNFLHLTGVTSHLPPKKFFEKCLDGNLTETDFSISSKQQKGSVRRKVSVLEMACQMFYQKSIVVEEHFVKNKIYCAIASSDGGCTLGFTDTIIHIPKTLLKGNELKYPLSIDAVLRRKTGETEFKEVIFMKSDLELQMILEK